MELTTRIFVFLMIIAAGLGTGAALGKAHFNSGAGQPETAAVADKDDDYLGARRYFRFWPILPAARLVQCARWRKLIGARGRL